MTEIFPLAGRKVWVAGHRGMAGSAILRRLQAENCEILTAGRDVLDLSRQTEVEDWLAANKPDVVFLAAATVGGIVANATRPAEFIHDNLIIETNVIHGAYKTGVKKLLFLGSSCIYPKEAPQPMAENALLTGSLGTLQRMVCRRQDCGHQAVPSLSSPIWLRLHFCDAYQLIRHW